MIIVIDIGNTLTDVAFYEGDGIKYLYKTKSDTNRLEPEYMSSLALFLKAHDIDVSSVEGEIVCSVVPSLTKVWNAICLKVFGNKAKVMGPRLKTGLAVKADNPKEVGNDLVAVSVGAKAKYGPKTLIADLGTASKVILIDKDGCFSGVTIAPGLKISYDALVNGAAALSETSLNVPKNVIGRNTEDCMNSGITYGTAFMIRGFAEAFEKEVGYPLQKILTGGYAHYIKDILNEFEYDEDLLLFGLKTTYDKNA